ncbi:MAG: PIN domain-containing protein [Myxococcaceae bacterium]
MNVDRPVLLDTDTLSEFSRGQGLLLNRARTYLERNGRFTFSAITVFERLRGYLSAIEEGRPLEPQLAQFEALVRSSIVLPIDSLVANEAASIWAAVGAKRRKALGDILIAATAIVHGLPLVTRNRRDFEFLASLAGAELELMDWTR